MFDWVEAAGNFVQHFVIPLVSAYAIGAAGRWLARHGVIIDEAHYRAKLEDLLEDAVRAAEQKFGPKAGEEKRQAVLEHMLDLGYSKKEIDTALEAKVNTLYPNFPDPAVDADGE
jgi:hypothetical protein